MRLLSLVGLLSLLAATPAVAPPPILACAAESRPVARWDLPPLFREISGLAFAPDGRLFIHNDERSFIGVVDTATGRVVATYQLGIRPVRSDFEDIAIVGDTVVMVTSDGVLFQAPVPKPGSSTGVLPFTTVETRIGQRCEIEGMALDPRDRTLLLACKSARSPELGRDIAIFRWSFDRRAMATPDRIVVPIADLAGHRRTGFFHPSAIAIDPPTGEMVLLSAVEQTIVVTDRAGKVLGAGPVAKRHRQPEGLAIAANGTFYVGDEGAKGPGSITVYSCR